jgi:hypothetical protein
MKITVADTFVIEFPGIPEIDEVKPRYKTIEDFATQEDFNEYIIEITKPILFYAISEEEKARTRRYYRRSDNWEARFYDLKGNCVFKYSVPTADYHYRNKDYYYHNRNKMTEEQKEALRQEELKNIPIDIFLSISGFTEVNVCYVDYRTQYVRYNSCNNYPVVIAWLLGISKYREFNKVIGGFIENYINVFQETKSKAIIKYEAEKALEKYHEIYGVGKQWRLN